MASYGLRLRPTRPEDEGLLHAWASDPAFRSVFGEGAGDSVDGSSAELRLIVEQGSRPVGQVRLELVEPTTAAVTIALTSEFRGRGVGRRALELAALEARERLGATTITALVPVRAEAALRAFAAAGFETAGTNGDAVELRRDA